MGFLHLRMSFPLSRKISLILWKICPNSWMSRSIWTDPPWIWTNLPWNWRNLPWKWKTHPFQLFWITTALYCKCTAFARQACRKRLYFLWRCIENKDPAAFNPNLDRQLDLSTRGHLVYCWPGDPALSISHDSRWLGSTPHCIHLVLTWKPWQQHNLEMGTLTRNEIWNNDSPVSWWVEK